jgi:hypothetical protein
MGMKLGRIQAEDVWGRKWWETGEDYIMRSFITCTKYY